jgi:hypothetical protein
MLRNPFTIAAAALLLVSAFAYPSYRGSAYSFLLFDVSFVAALALVLPRPRSHAYLFLALMLFLGFWWKVMLHVLSGTQLLEPVGDFSGAPEAWDRALDVASVAAIGLSAARLLHLALAGVRRASADVAPHPVPSWYAAWRRTTWIASVLAMVALNLLNVQLAFYQAGVNPRLILPYHLNVLPGWLISIGFALWFAVLVHWEVRTHPRRLAALLVVPIVEGSIASTAALSRSLYFLHTLPYFFALARDWAKRRMALPVRTRLTLVTAWGLCFALSLTFVSALRINIYYLAYEPKVVSVPGQTEVVAEPAAGATMSNQIKPTFHEVTKLFIGRWIGLEGVLAVSSYRGLGFELFAEASGRPSQDNAMLYQTISKSGYEITARFTFGTLPGVVGLLFYSGSLAVVCIGMMVVGLLMVATEHAALRFTGNPFFTSVIALGMAHAACQMQFPYLTGIYLAQLWVAIAFVWLLGAARGLSRQQHSSGSAHA